jgi:hypothetical protein
MIDPRFTRGIRRPAEEVVAEEFDKIQRKVAANIASMKIISKDRREMAANDARKRLEYRQWAEAKRIGVDVEVIERRDRAAAAHKTEINERAERAVAKVKAAQLDAGIERDLQRIRAKRQAKERLATPDREWRTAATPSGARRAMQHGSYCTGMMSSEGTT